MKKFFTLISCLFYVAFAFASEKPVALAPPPVAQFNASGYSGCAPYTVTFYNSSEGNGTYFWNFGDPSSPNNTSTACSPTHTFINPGSYLVTLTYYYNANVYYDTATITVWPRPNPTVNGQDTVCAKSVHSYTATGTAGSSYYWTVTGGSIVGPANGSSVSVNWTTPGVGMLTVTETTIHGCSNNKTFKVLVAPQPELGSFCEDRKGTAGQGNPEKPDQLGCKCQKSIVTFQALSIDNYTVLENGLYTFQWVVTGGSIQSGAGTNTINVLVGNGPTMTVSLVVFNQFGCIDSGKCVFDVCPAPVASFKADTACFTGQTNFDASQSTVQNQITNYQWSFGDNSTTTTNSNLTNHTYGAPNVYNVKLTVKNKDGCTDDTIVKVLVKPGDAPPIGCLGTVCHGTKKCYGTPYYAGATYNWTVIGGVGTPNAQGDSICVVWGNGPQGTIKLEVIGGPYTCGKNTVNIPIFPAILNIYGQDTICTGSKFTFSTDLIPGSCYSWAITTPSGSTFVINPATNPGNVISELTPNTPGTYTISLSMNNDLVCCNGHTTRTIVVQAPIQIFGNFNLCEFSSFTYASSVPVTWAVTNGVITASTVTSCTVSWGAANYGTISATALNPNLVCDNTATYAVTLIPAPDALPIYGNTLVCKGSTETYTHDPMAAGVTDAWFINPNTGITIVSTSPYKVKFNAAGNYTISVIYSNFYGCKDTSFLNITVLDTLKPTISGPNQACKGSTKIYTMTPNPGGAWQWNVVGGQILYQSDDSIIINWGNINMGQVNIQNTLCGGFKNYNVTINAIPTGIITVGKGSCKGDTVRLTAPPGYSYSWSPSGSTQSILATFPTLNYSVIIGQNGCFDTLFQSFSPFPKLPKPNVNINYNCMLAPNTPIPYLMTATYNSNWQYSWTPQTAIPANTDTSNTHYSTLQNSTHTVIVTNEFGCKDTASVQLTAKCLDTIYCQNPPCGGSGCACKATFTIQYNPCTGYFSFTQISGDPITAIYWNFFDGDYSNYFNPQHFYQSLGTKTVQVSVWCGCNWVTQTFNITVPYILRPKMTHNFPIVCNYKTINLIAGGGHTTLGATSHFIDWGDASTTSAALPQSHTYSVAGTYIVSYTVSATGCSKTIYDTVIVLPFKAAFGFCDSGCVGQAVQFVDHSTTASQYPIVHWKWTFGDLTGSNLQSPFHIYATVGIFNPKLVIQNQQGCKDSITLSIVITNFNAGALTYKKNGVAIALPGDKTFNICEGDYIEAIGPTGSGYTYAWSNGVSTKIDTIKKTGKYWVVIANGRGCTDTLGPFFVVVNPLPFASILSADTFCQNSIAKLSALPGPGYTYNWTSVPAQSIGATNPTFFPSATPGNYTVSLQVTNLFGCSATTSKVITIQAAPSVYISANTTAQLCEGDSVQLTANIAGSYTSVIWSTGDTTLSIWVRSNGLYSCSVGNAFGCTAIGQYFVSNIGERPNLSNVPKGCYKVCGKRGVGAIVCGPYPKKGQRLYYNWYKDSVLISTNQNLTILASGCYHIEVKDSATSCISISAPFCVSFTFAPVAIIISPTPNPTLCVGFNGTINLAADSIQNDVIYTWYLNGTHVYTGTSYTATQPGVYTLVAYFSKCCNDSDMIIIEEGECCFPPGTVFTLIQDSTVYTSDVVWDGKYYVAGRVFVRNKAILDLTEIDVVFDRDGEIIFEDTSIVRATNSVFRPCEMLDAWQGFSFYDHSWGFMQANNFKSADSAVFVNTYGPECVKLHDNFFSNCHVGIAVSRQQGKPYNQGITGNSFVIDNTNFNKPALYNSTEFFGIRVFGTKMEELISQNSFRNSDFTSQGNKYYGIWGLRSSATMSENKFSNMYRSIDWTVNTSSTFIENNEMEQTYNGKFPFDYQVRFSDCSQPLVVFGNEMRSSDNNGLNNTAIYAQNMVNLNIRDNNIKGFKYGIYTLNLNTSLINENDVDNAGSIGIFNSDSKNTDINCNIVRMKDYKAPFGGPGFNGTGISMFNGNASNRIFSNCIFDTRYAIMARNSVAVNYIPLIHNNYMYNYIVAGIYTQNHAGNIGTLASPGKNTFVCNNHNNGAGGKDIWSIGGAVVERCNFGIAYLAGTASSAPACPGTSMYSSTAACGHQIVNTKYYRTDEWDICDIYNGKLDIIIIDHDGDKDHDVDKVKTGFKIKVKEKEPIELIAISRVLIGMKDKPTFGMWMTQLQTENVLTPFEISMLNAEWAKANENVGSGLQFLSTAATATQDEADIKAVTSISWRLENGETITESDISILEQIDDSRGRYAAQARDVIHLLGDKHDYIFKRETMPAEPELEGLQKSNDSYIRVVPNPASKSVTVEFMIQNDGDNHVSVTDISGRVMMVEVATIAQGRYKLNISNLASGMYWITVTDATTHKRYTAKLVKD